MIELTDAALSAVRDAMVKAGKSDGGFRVMIEDGGCAGLKYLVGIDSTPREDDLILDADGVRVFIDPASQPLLAGVTVDFINEMDRRGFSFENPNATAKCSCGKSFC